MHEKRSGFLHSEKSLTFWGHYIELAKQRGVYKGRRVKYSSEATGADKLVYDRVIEILNQQRSIKDISVEVGIPRKTVYAIRDRQKVND